jgi:REP element-mobilizing transposase RayT
MARKPRVEFAGGVFHVLARRVDRRVLFVDEADFKRYVRLLQLTVERFDWILLAFCLMPNHIHLMVELRKPNLAKGMQSLQLRYVRWFNDRHAREGRLFEHRYKSRVVADEVYFATLVAYIETNPVRGALCAKPEEWQWSSRAIVASGIEAAWLADDVLRERRAAIAELK